jgi:uncharacterized protein YbaR (Trm112 family)
MLPDEVLAILACPACKSRLTLEMERWLVCQNPECQRKYPIRDYGPDLVIEEGDKYAHVAIQDLPQPDHKVAG